MPVLSTPTRDTDHQLRSLRAFGILSLAIPLLVGLAFGIYRYTQSQAEFSQQVDRSLRVANEHASKVLVISEALQDRVNDLVKGRSAEDLKRHEAELHAALQELTKNQAQIRTVWILGPDGKPLASSRTYPVQSLDMTDRRYFRFHEAGPGMRHMSHPIVGRGSGDEIIDFSVGFPGPDGGLGGVINIGLATAYLRQFYSDLAASEPGLAVAMFNRDGDIFARWPSPTPGAAKMAPDIPMMRQILSGQDEGSLTGTSSDGEQRLITYKRVSDNYPLYVGAGMSITALRLALWKDIVVLLAFGIPPSLAFWFAIRAAARRARLAAEAARQLAVQTASRHKAEEALIQSQKLEALGRVAGGVAHEFNNALMVISTNAHLLARMQAEPNRRIDSILRAVASSTQLTRQLLSFTRRQPLAPQKVHSNEVLASVAPLLSPVLGGRVTLELDLEPDLPMIYVDVADLELALVNLAINARDAMPDGGTFHVRAKRIDEVGEGSVVSIQAVDSGCGVAPENLQKVFEPFFTTKEVGAGNGLGLAQVRSFCERGGGSVEIESEVGFGTTVTLRLPATEPVSPSATDPDAGRVVLQAGKTVLLVEDDDMVADGLVPMLESFGCKASRVDRAAAALRWLDLQPSAPDIVVSDVRMPGELDGLGLARILRTRLPATPVLLITGYADGMTEIEKENFPLLPKPCSAAALQAAIARLVN